MRSERIPWMYVILLLLSVAGCSAGDVDAVAPPPTSALSADTTTYVVQRGTVTRKLEFDGRVTPIEEIPLYFETAGYVTQIHVKQGDRVKTGDLLAELETVGLQDQIALAELDVELAGATLRQAEDANEHAVAQAEAALEMARVQLSAAEQHLSASAYAAMAAGTQLEQAQALQAQATEAMPYREGTVEVAQSQLSQAISAREAARHAVAVQEITVNQAETELEQLMKGVDPILELQVQRTELALNLLKKGSELVAAVDGEVFALSLYPGRPVEPFAPVLVVVDPSRIEVSANLAGEQLQQLTEGAHAEIALSTDPDRTWQGTVRRLPYAYRAGSNVKNTTGSDVFTRIRLEGDIGALWLGALVRVTVVLEEKGDVLWLPPDAIRTFQGRSFVIVQDGDRQRRVDTELGLEGAAQVEVVKGLQEGQVVIAP